MGKSQTTTKVWSWSKWSKVLLIIRCGVQIRSTIWTLEYIIICASIYVRSLMSDMVDVQIATQLRSLIVQTSTKINRSTRIEITSRCRLTVQAMSIVVVQCSFSTNCGECSTRFGMFHVGNELSLASRLRKKLSWLKASIWKSLRILFFFKFIADDISTGSETWWRVITAYCAWAICLWNVFLFIYCKL